MAAFSYILPIKSDVAMASAELSAYITWLSDQGEVIIPDGSPHPVFEQHARAWAGIARHIPVRPDLVTPMGKVGGVLTAVAEANSERLIIGDEDVRYDATSLQRVLDALDVAHVVRPQNYFTPLPWHACWDTGRILLNRLTGGDWPGTLGVRRSVLERTGGYDGRAMFENLELVRTVIAAGGVEAVLPDVFVARRPSTTKHFWSQRVRQAYDEIARPRRMAVQLCILPLLVWLAVAREWETVLILAGAVVPVAELGRRGAGGRKVFPWYTSLFAPLWLLERAVCAWLALLSHLLWGGVLYRGRVLRHAATPLRELQMRFAHLVTDSPPQ